MPNPSDSSPIAWWESLKHGGMLIAPARVAAAFADAPDPLSPWHADRLRREIVRAENQKSDLADLLDVVLEQVCGFTVGWFKGTRVGSEWSTRTPAGENIKPRRVWQHEGGTLPVFVDEEHRLGIGRGRRSVARVIEWLRARSLNLALLTNGRQWRLIYAGIDHDAFSEWDTQLWFAEGEPGLQVDALRRLIAPSVWKAPPPAHGETKHCPLLQAILDSRKGQNELSAILGERVRQAVELLIRSHGPALDRLIAQTEGGLPPVDGRDIYAAAVRTIMRMVVLMFSESRLLMPMDRSPLYFNSYSLAGLREALESAHARGPALLHSRRSAWPRVLALFALVRDGCGHPDLSVPKYGGDLFTTGQSDPNSGMSRALAVFESACFQSDFAGVMSDADVRDILEKLSYSEMTIRQGRGSIRTRVPVDFSDLQSEYIGILYEGLLDFELRRAAPDEPIVFLAIGDEPALPLSRLEAMDDSAIKNLVEKFKVKGGGDEDDGGEDADEADAEAEDDEPTADEPLLAGNAPEEDPAADAAQPGDTHDPIQLARERAWTWARRAVSVGGMVRKPKSKKAEAVAQYEREVETAGRKLVRTAILPGQWYLVRWGGTRKGSGTFYTRPQLSVPTVHRTLRPLTYIAPKDNADAPTAAWTPKKPEEILALKVCDPAVGSGSFPVAALRFLTDALYRSLEHHGRLRDEGNKTVIALAEGRESAGRLDEDLLPCRPTDTDFEPRLKARLRRYVVERCLYGVDLDPLAIELAKIALWIETMDRELPFSFLDHKFKCGNALVGCWFDRFRHYPIMAWLREGGDKGHTTGVHFAKEARTKAIAKHLKDVIKPDLVAMIDRMRGQGDLFTAEGKTAEQVHDEALTILEQMHRLAPGEDGEHQRATLHRQLRESPAYVALKRAFDCWCALWFWPADQLAAAPLPTKFSSLSPEAINILEKVAAKQRFFHWEIEFPEGFRSKASGFDAVLGNPPWENMQPNPEEFFSNRNPLFRTLGRLEKQRWQKEAFGQDAAYEASYVQYFYDFKCLANWFAKCDSCFDSAQAKLIASAPAARPGYSDSNHPFRHQSGRLSSYKLFLEMTHALLARDGRLGLIVPSSLYTDSSSQLLRELFVERCRWEWLFGFENRDGIFDIHRSFKFNAVIIVKGGETSSIRTAFMQRDIDDWALGASESLAIPYARDQVERFSPKSKALLEIRSSRDLAVLHKLYANSVLLGDRTESGWGIRYAIEFMMNTDAELFPPRPEWESRGYRADEYGRWLKGTWLPRTAGNDCPSPLNGKRANVAPGILLSRDGTSYISEQEINWEVKTVKVEGKDVELRSPAVALPLYEGRMIGQFDFSEKGWVSGKGRTAEWREIEWTGKQVEPQFLMQAETFRHAVNDDGEPATIRGLKVGFMDVTAATNRRTMIASLVNDLPCGNKVPILATSSKRSAATPLVLCGVLDAFAYDFQLRNRLGGLTLNYFIAEETCLPAQPEPKGATSTAVAGAVARLVWTSAIFADCWWRALRTGAADESRTWRSFWASSPHERLRLRCILDAAVAALYGLDLEDLKWILKDCDHPLSDTSNKVFTRRLDPKGFWRVDKHEPPERRHTVLTLAAFADLSALIAAVTVAGGTRDNAIAAFCGRATKPLPRLKDLIGLIDVSEGWMLPENFRLADLGLGHDDRAEQPQPVAATLGPRFYDWQLSQNAAESWRECELHARNLLGAEGFEKLKAELEGRDEAPLSQATTAAITPAGKSKQKTAKSGPTLFE